VSYGEEISGQKGDTQTRINEPSLDETSSDT